MRRISPELRDEAALIAQCIASNDYGPPRPCPCLYCVTRDLDASPEARQLAEDARQAALQITGRRITNANYGEIFAEAEALLRTGWKPT